MSEFELKNDETLEWLDAMEIGIDLSQYPNEENDADSDVS
ncbi:Uncharacterised protein [Vibrio vulnificus]|nr:hypothetical protein VVMO6_03722 [Vibrio vulnificus MO6-24/O]OJH77669.1 hypothetical protein VVS222_00291 [Vibrio vulnificus]OJI20357.1 hypothetical protein VV99796_03843 [Vibrio vulnificus]OJI47261.1 hypothetical protein VVS316_02928 [Vibrio vulnificus]SUQ30051.1 Uncharacterised protein [Vibrio vulnificus]